MNSFGIITSTFYLIATFFLVPNLQNNDDGKKYQKLAIVLFCIGLCLHAYLLFSILDISSELNLGFFNSVSLTSWIILILILIGSFFKPILNISIIMLPISALSILLALKYPSHYELATDASLGLELHIAMSLISYSLLSLAALQACLLSFQEHQIRHKQPSRILNSLPPLQVMEDLLVQVITLGFFILSLSLVSGVMFVDNIFAQHLVHKVAFSVIAWLIFAIVLYGRWQNGWRGQTLFRWTITGAITLLLAYFGSKFVLELLLERV